jgi:hypothetical protein
MDITPQELGRGIRYAAAKKKGMRGFLAYRIAGSSFPVPDGYVVEAEENLTRGVPDLLGIHAVDTDTVVLTREEVIEGIELYALEFLRAPEPRSIRSIVPELPSVLTVRLERVAGSESAAPNFDGMLVVGGEPTGGVSLPDQLA